MATKKIEVTARVNAYRARILKDGGSTLYANIGREATDALTEIMEKKGYSKAGAIEYALQRTAADVRRRR